MLFLMALALVPTWALLTLALIDAEAITSRQERIEDWAFRCSGSAAYAALEPPERVRQIRDLRLDEMRTWTWTTSTPYGGFGSHLTVVREAEPLIRGGCVQWPIMATTRARMRFAGEESARIVQGSWSQCGVRAPCRE